MKNKKVSIVIVNYNGSRYLSQLVESVNNLKIDSYSIEIIFVDNASSDDSLKVLDSLLKENRKDIQWKILKAKKNLGFAEGNNYGVKNSNGEFIAFLNNDTVVHENWLLSLLNIIDGNDHIGIVSSKLVFFPRMVSLTFDNPLNRAFKIRKKYKKGTEEEFFVGKYCKNFQEIEDFFLCDSSTSLCIPVDFNVNQSFTLSFETDSELILEFQNVEYVLSGKVEINLELDCGKIQEVDVIQNAGSRIVSPYSGQDIGAGEIDCGQYDKNRNLELACGAAMLLRKEDFNKVKGFDKLFFMYYEDSDLSLRIRKLGKEIIFVPNSIVRHIHTGSSKEWSPFFTYFVFRNRLLFILKNYSVRAFSYEWLKELKRTIICIVSQESYRQKFAKSRALIDSFVLSFYYLFIYLKK